MKEFEEVISALESRGTGSLYSIEYMPVTISLYHNQVYL
jgi:hypothetical protein